MFVAKQTQGAAVLPFRARIVPTVADENTTAVIAVLQEQLDMARTGKLRSVAIVSVSQDGSAIGTQWSCTSTDVSSLIGKLAVLQHDLMAARA